MKLLDSFVNFGKGFASLPKIGKYAVIGAALYFAFLFGGNKKESEFSVFKAEYEQVLKRADTLSRTSDSLKARVEDLREGVAAKDSTISRLTVTLEWRGRQNRKLSSDLAVLEARLEDSTVMRDTAQILQIKDSIIDNLTVQVANRDTIIAGKDSIITVQEEQKDSLNLALDISNQRGDSLQTFIDSLPPAPKDPDKIWGIIPKPSRKTVAVVSFVGGVLATLFAVK